MLRRKFAVIKLWPDWKAAEDEIIERLRISAESVNLQCLVVDSFGRLMHPPHTQLTQDDVDFVLSLHFETPKVFDIFSFVTLWNPLQFYQDWSYRKFTRHLLTHDDFLSCDSRSGDDHVMRSASNHPRREPPLFNFYPTLSGPILEPGLGEKRLFYAGMNWERFSKRPGRHAELLAMLDQSGVLRIYGPKTYRDMEVWQGFHSYAGPIPFDGVSVVRLINQAGISLVLSSQAHIEAEMMSSRIFESSAAGALIICSENAFARRHFGDSLLYIDTTLAPQETYGQVQAHLAWIQSEPAKALEMAKRSQAVFLQKFRLDTCLERIYGGLEARKAQLASAYTPQKPEEKICVVFLMPEFQPEILEQHIVSCESQKNVAIRGVVAMDSSDAELFRERVSSRLSESAASLEIAPVHFMERRPDGSLRRRRPAGEVLSELIRNLVAENYVCFVAPAERLFSDHLGSLLRVLQDFPEAGCAWSDMVRISASKDQEQAVLCEDPDVGSLTDNPTLGFGRFLFRVSAIDERLHTALPYLDALPMHLLFGMNRNVPTRRCTLTATGADPIVTADHPVSVNLEREILIDLAPKVFRINERQDGPSQTPHPAAPSLAGMTPEERTQFAVELAHSVPFPNWLKKLAFGAYRLWFRMTGSRPDVPK